MLEKRIFKYVKVYTHSSHIEDFCRIIINDSGKNKPLGIPITEDQAKIIVDWANSVKLNDNGEITDD